MDATLTGSNTIHGPAAQKMVTQHPDRFWMSTCFDDSVDLEGTLTWDQCHWKPYEILVPTIYRTSKSDFVCVLGVQFKADCF
jgi:hypothetical protein